MNCHICNKPLAGKYYVDAWDHKVCASHVESGEVVSCASCTGFTEKSGTLSDGRTLCAICMNSAIKIGDETDTITHFVVKQLAKVGFTNIANGDFSVEVTTAVEMAKLRGDGVINPLQKGLALTRSTQSVSLFGRGNKKLQHTIYNLEYQPKVEFAGTLAHELLHVWQQENDITPPAKLCEGLCNMGAYYVISKIDSVLTSKLMKTYEQNPDPIYGDGFREVLALKETSDWEELIKYYKNNYKNKRHGTI